MSGKKLTAVLRCAALLLAAAMLAGCGSGSGPQVKPADPQKAAASLQANLEKWKSGVTIDALSQEKPTVHVVDEDWQAGQKLVSFELRDVGDQVGATARIAVRLNLQSPNGQWWKEVEYRVSTEPFVSIVRKDE